MKVTLYNQQAEKVGEVDLSPKIFEVKPSLHLLAEATRIQQRNARKGNSNTKTRGEVSGGGKKPWKQKGTGRARVGSIRSPIWRHGGVTFGPTSARNWELKMNKKAKSKALFMSLSDKAKAGNFLVLENIHLDPIKTKEFVKVVEAFKKSLSTLGKNLMLVIPKSDKNLIRVSRNLTKVKTVLASSLNVVDVMTADSMLVLKDSLPVIEKTYLKTVKQA